MGARAKPIAYWDRVHPAVLCTGMVCVLLGWLGLLAAVLACLRSGLDPEPVLKYFGPAAVLGAVAWLLNQAGVIGLKSQLGRIERYVGTDGRPTTVDQAVGVIPAQASDFDHVVYGSQR